jgi:lipopolysaccharide/colanic/teichoic acid biosynthesis glycosyltransferase
MNNPEALKISTYEEEETNPLSGSGRPCESSEQTEPLASKRSLFVVWSNVRSTADRQTKSSLPARSISADSSVPMPAPGDDRGLWLIRDGIARHQGWARVDAEADPLQAVWPYASPSCVTAKRLCDVVASSALLVLLFPLLMLIAALVRLDSPGPALFRQLRIGKDGKEFLLWKVRSMFVDAPKYAPSPIGNLDRRLTRMGRLIRRVSLDELPQLINVLKGEMSLVGPRPEMPFIVDGYTSLERRRLAVKPGITGLWQVSPARAFPIHENLQYDLHYIRHQNLMLDGAILLRTIAAVIRGVGAV